MLTTDDEKAVDAYERCVQQDVDKGIRGATVIHSLAEAHIASRYETWSTIKPRSIRLNRVEDESGVEEVFGILGFICAKKLPPINDEIKRHKIRSERQSVQITGLGSPQFDVAVSTLQRLLEVMAKDHAVSDDVSPLEIGANGGYTSLTFSNRLVTSRNELGMEQEVSVPPFIDPRGILHRAMGEDYVHSEENVVTYKDRLETRQVGRNNIDPGSFKVGDLVNIRFTPILVKGRQNENRMLLVMRCLERMDSSFVKGTDRHQGHLLRRAIPTAVKRRRRSSDGSDEGIKRLRIDDSVPEDSTMTH